MENFKRTSSPIKNWSTDDRPREKMQAKGAAALSNSELLAILINNGSKEKSALEIAKDVLALCQNNLNELGKLTTNDLQKLKGIGAAKAITIAAALEIGRRRQGSELLSKTVVRTSGEIAQYLKTALRDYSHEVFAVVFLNRANKIISFQIISTGGLTGTVADPRIILKKAIEAEACSIVLSHNHPSGSLKPSRADEMLTKRIKEAAVLLDMNVIDHIIVSEDGYYSFADEGII